MLYSNLLRSMAVRIRCLILAVAIAFFLNACVIDQDDPYDDDATPQIDWPSADPNRYHWDGFSDPFFEGWFFRLSLPEENASFAFLYGVRNPGADTPADGEAFVVALGSDGTLIQSLRPVDEFAGSLQALDVKVGDNRATASAISGALADDDHSISWDLTIDATDPWTDTMGILTNIPFLPVNWYVGALQTRATGTIVWNGKKITVNGAPLFQDHNWAGTFPAAYIWLQAMDFADDDEALAFSGGDLGAVDGGMLIWRKADETVQVRTQDFNAWMEVDVDAAAQSLIVTITRDKERFVLTGEQAGATVVAMPAPTRDGFTSYSHMALDGRLRVQRYELVGWQWLLREDHRSSTCGVEIGGAYLDVE